MKRAMGVLAVVLMAGGAGAYGQANGQPVAPQANGAAKQQPSPAGSTTGQQATGAVAGQKPQRSPGGDIGSGGGDIGKGAGKGAGNLAAGTGKGAADLVTLHPVNAAGDVGKGAGKAGKNVGVGAAKGTGKIAKGTGRAIKHIF